MSMNKKEERAVKTILTELCRRLPENNSEGFLPSEEVSQAIEYLTDRLYPDDLLGFEASLHKQESNTLVGMIKQTLNEYEG